jgi:hypothetical protein
MYIWHMTGEVRRLISCSPGIDAILSYPIVGGSTDVGAHDFHSGRLRISRRTINLSALSPFAEMRPTGTNVLTKRILPSLFLLLRRVVLITRRLKDDDSSL